MTMRRVFIERDSHGVYEEIFSAIFRQITDASWWVCVGDRGTMRHLAARNKLDAVVVFEEAVDLRYIDGIRVDAGRIPVAVVCSHADSVREFSMLLSVPGIGIGARNMHGVIVDFLYRSMNGKKEVSTAREK